MFALKRRLPSRATARSFARWFKASSAMPSAAPSTSSLQQPDLPNNQSAPIAYQDFGRNKPKVYYYLSDLDTTANHANEQSIHQLLAVPVSTEVASASRSDVENLAQYLFGQSISRADKLSYSQSLKLSFIRRLTPALSLLLPANFPVSVSSAYLPYSAWSMLGNSLSCAGGVLSIQCLLAAVGLGHSLAVPSAAAIQWVLKDGLGQLGGMLFAAYVNVSFDSDAKQWRFLSSLMLDCSTAVEIVTPLFPSLFLPLAAAANVGKNVAWISATASRAAIHRSFLTEENLADVTAKAASQSIAASLVGTALGVGLSYAIGSDSATILTVFGALSFGHIICMYKSLNSVPMATLNRQRSERVFLNFIQSNSILSPEQVRQSENFVRLFRSTLEHSSVVRSPSLNDCVQAYQQLHHHLTISQGMLGLIAQFDQEQFFLTASVTGARSVKIMMLIKLDATSGDVIAAHFMMAHVRQSIENHYSESSTSLTNSQLRDIIQSSLSLMQSYRADFLASLEIAGWNCEHLFLEHDKLMRINVFRRH